MMKAKAFGAIYISCCTLLISNSGIANDTGQLPDILGGLSGKEVRLMTAKERSGTRGESMKKQESQYGFCGLRRCTKMFINNQHLYTVYEDGSVYFVKK